MSQYDIAIVGAGIVGATLAAEVAPHARVLLLETEDQPGYHSTGRSAAFWSETYGGPAIQPLAQPRTRHHTAPRPRDIELRLEQGDWHQTISMSERVSQRILGFVARLFLTSRPRISPS